MKRTWTNAGSCTSAWSLTSKPFPNNFFWWHCPQKDLMSSYSFHKANVFLMSNKWPSMKNNQNMNCCPICCWWWEVWLIKTTMCRYAAVWDVNWLLMFGSFALIVLNLNGPPHHHLLCLMLYLLLYLLLFSRYVVYIRDNNNLCTSGWKGYKLYQSQQFQNSLNEKHLDKCRYMWFHLVTKIRSIQNTFSDVLKDTLSTKRLHVLPYQLKETPFNIQQMTVSEKQPKYEMSNGFKNKCIFLLLSG